MTNSASYSMGSCPFTVSIAFPLFKAHYSDSNNSRDIRTTPDQPDQFNNIST